MESEILKTIYNKNLKSYSAKITGYQYVKNETLSLAYTRHKNYSNWLIDLIIKVKMIIFPGKIIG